MTTQDDKQNDKQVKEASELFNKSIYKIKKAIYKILGFSDKINSNNKVFIIIERIIWRITLIAIAVNIVQGAISFCISKPFLGITAGDFLAFWGAYIGGIATLVGVSLTIWQGNKDKEESEKKERPIIVPLKTKYPYLIDSNNNIVPNETFLKNVTLDKLENKQLFLSIPVEVVNLGKEHALNLQVILKQIDYSMIRDSIKTFGIINNKIYEQFIENIEKKEMSIDNEEIRISQADESNTIYLDQMLYILFMDIIKNIYNLKLGIINSIPINNIPIDISNFLMSMENKPINIERFPICKIEFKFTDIYAKPYSNKYLIYAGFSINSVTENEYQDNIVKKANVILTFKNIDKEK